MKNLGEVQSVRGRGGKRFVVHADETLGRVLELEAARESGLV
jgi:hypothetical protein